MRFAAQRTIGMQDMLPADGSVYMPNMDKTMGSMMQALKAWERKRGLSYSFKGKFIENRPKKKVEEKPKAKAPSDRPIKVPREAGKPGRKKEFTAEERKQRKNENNRLYREKRREEHRKRSAEWRAKLTPEQKADIQRRNREWKRAKKQALADAANGSGANGVPLANPGVSGKAR